MSSVSSSSSASNKVPTCDPAACTCLDLDTSSSSLHVATRGVFVALNALRDLRNAHGHLVQDIKKLRTETEEPPSFLPPRVVVPAPVPVAAPAVSPPVIPAVPVVAAVPEVSLPSSSYLELKELLDSTNQLISKPRARSEEQLLFLPSRVVVSAPAPAPFPVGAPTVSARVIPAVPEVPRLSVPELFQVLESYHDIVPRYFSIISGCYARINALNQGVSSNVRRSKRRRV
jgi:hypothetical protein